MRALHRHVGIVLALVAALAALPGGPAQSQSAPPNGAQLFRQRCGACHAVAGGPPVALGPSLTGVVGRRAGANGFPYSPALRGADIVWTRQNLDRFLTSPTRMVPGTRMVIAVPDARQRAAIIDYLGSVR